MRELYGLVYGWRCSQTCVSHYTYELDYHRPPASQRA